MILFKMLNLTLPLYPYKLETFFLRQHFSYIQSRKSLVSFPGHFQFLFVTWGEGEPENEARENLQFRLTIMPFILCYVISGGSTYRSATLQILCDIHNVQAGLKVAY